MGRKFLLDNKFFLDKDAFNSLLSAWNHHQDLRFHGGSVAQLAASRIELDRRRSVLR